MAALQSKIKLITEEYDKHRKYLARNHELFDIYEGNLKPYVENIMKASLSDTYFAQIKHRIMPINILRRIIDKLAQVYSNDPIREVSEKQDILEMYQEFYSINNKMNNADEFSNLFKGYALEPFIRTDRITGESTPSLRVLPFDRFFVIGEDLVDPLNPTIFVKIMGKVTMQKGLEEMSFFAYTDTEFLAFTESGKILSEYMVNNEGVNIFGKIPFVYGNRSNYNIMPTQDTDILEMSKIIPVLFSDLGGMIMFSCFPINYGIDVDTTNLVMSPNIFWNLKSLPESGKSGTIGTITPTAEVDKVLNFISHTLSAWLESKGIKVGSLGQLNGDNFASGISKIIDEMDTYEIRKRQIQFFKKEEKELWQLTSIMHNVWIKTGLITNVPALPEKWEVTITYDEPVPYVDRQTEVATVKMEVDGNFLDQKSAIKRLYPDLTDEEVEERMELISSSFMPRIEQDAATEDSDSDKSETQQES